MYCKTGTSIPYNQKTYLIQKGYVGNAINWWRDGDAGYTTEIRKAKQFTKQEALDICKDESYTAWDADFIFNAIYGQKLIFDGQYLDQNFQLK